MESEIDLRPYIIAILRRWRLILISTLVIAMLGGAVGTLGHNIHSASADVLIVPISSQITLDPRFQTTNSNQVTSPASQRQALVSLVSSQKIAEQISKDVGGVQGEEIKDAQALLGQISVTSESDLLQIVVTDPDPDRALVIATAWGQAYERLVAEIYTRSQFHSDLISDEIADAEQRYAAAQQELEVFLSDGQMITVNNQIQQLTNVLSSSREAQRMLYSDYFTRTRELDLILADAQTLREQVGTQSGESFSESFSMLLLQARTVNSQAPLFQLSASDLSADQGIGRSSSADLDQLITVLSRRREQLLAEANDLAEKIASGSANAIGFDEPTHQRYIDQLARLESSYEQFKARQALLTEQRNLARDTLILLQKKRDEQKVARSAPQFDVQFVSARINPQPSSVRDVLISGVAGGVIGLMLGLVLTILLYVVIPALRKLVSSEGDQASSQTKPSADTSAYGG